MSTSAQEAVIRGLPFAESEEGLRNVFLHSRYAPLANILSFARYFPRSPQRGLLDNLMTGLAGSIAVVFFGVGAAVFVFAIARQTLQPLMMYFLVSLISVTFLKTLIPRLYGTTSEESKFVELVALCPVPVVLIHSAGGTTSIGE